MQSTPGSEVTAGGGRGDSRRGACTHAPWLTVSACLEHDHRVLDAILLDVEAFVEDQNDAVAAEHFALFRARLATHIEAEETILFPLLEQLTGCDGPTRVMRREHTEVRRLLHALHCRLTGEETTVDPLFLIEELSYLLHSHNLKEEHVLYPAIDANAAATGELESLVAEVEAFLDGTVEPEWRVEPHDTLPPA